MNKKNIGSDWEVRALLRFVRDGGEQPSASLTETYEVGERVYISVANTRGVLAMYEVRPGSDGNMGLHLLPDASPFDEIHRRLADEGACDATGGGEYQRVLHEWREAGYPPDVEAFIRDRANAWPDLHIGRTPIAEVAMSTRFTIARRLANTPLIEEWEKWELVRAILDVTSVAEARALLAVATEQGST